MYCTQNLASLAVVYDESGDASSARECQVQFRGKATTVSEKLIVYTLTTSVIKAGDAEGFLEMLGYRIDYGFKICGTYGVARHQGLKILVRVFQIVNLSGALVGDQGYWTVELETQTEAQLVDKAIAEV
jgi:hypothetical protein